MTDVVDPTVLYGRVKTTLARCASLHARRHRLEYEDVYADACLLFLKACQTHDPARGDIEKRIGFLVSRRLRDPQRQEHKRQNRIYFTQVRRFPELAAYEQTPFDPDVHLPGATPLVRELVLDLLDVPTEVLDAGGPRLVRGRLRKWLRRTRRWPARKADAALREAREYFS